MQIVIFASLNQKNKCNMKTKHISILLAFFMMLSFSALGQEEDEEVQVYSFSGSRGLMSKNIHDFGTIKEVSSFTIELQNTGDTKMQIGDISIPTGVGVTVIKKIINPGEKSGIIVTVNPQYMGKGRFNKKLIISTITKNSKGTVIKKTAAYHIKGNIL